MMKLKYTINELLFEAVCTFSILGMIFRNSIGSWEPWYEFYTFTSHSRIGTLCLYLANIFLLILVFRCFWKYKNKVYFVFKLFGYALILYFAVWTFVSLSNSTLTEVFFGPVSTTVILVPLLFYVGFDEQLWRRIKKQDFAIYRVVYDCILYQRNIILESIWLRGYAKFHI